MRVRYTSRAFAEREEIFEYIGKRSTHGARSVKQMIAYAIRRLAQFPYSGHATSDRGVYELSITKYPYKVYFLVESDEVWIVHIRHTARTSRKKKK